MGVAGWFVNKSFIGQDITVRKLFQEHLVIVPFIHVSDSALKLGKGQRVWRRIRDAGGCFYGPFSPIRGLKAKILPYVLLGSAFQRKIEKL